MKGPFYVTRNSGDGTFITGTRQTMSYRSDGPPPYSKPLPYSLKVGMVENISSPYFKKANLGANTYLSYLSYNWGASLIGINIQSVHNRAYSEFLDKVREAPAIGTDLAEYKETLKLIATVGRALLHPLTTFGKLMQREAKQVYRHGGWKSAAEVPLVLCPSAWLAWHFGVDPLIKDYYSLLRRLADQPKPLRVVAKKSQKGKFIYDKNGQFDNMNWRVGAKLQADVLRTNENLSLWNDMGLVNPVAIAWELVPFSFVVDWFYPIGRYISSITDLLGYTVQNPQRVWRAQLEGIRAYRFPAVVKANEGTATYRAFRMERYLDGPSMKLQRLRAPGKVSAVRGFTAISLLLGTLNLRLNSKSTS